MTGFWGFWPHSLTSLLHKFMQYIWDLDYPSPLLVNVVYERPLVSHIERAWFTKSLKNKWKCVWRGVSGIMSPGSFAFELLEYNEIKISNSAENVQFVSYVIEQMVRYVDSKGVSHAYFPFPSHNNVRRNTPPSPPIAQTHEHLCSKVIRRFLFL